MTSNLNIFLERNFCEVQSRQVTIEDFVEYLQDIGLPPDRLEEVEKQLLEFDSDRTGEIEFEAFKAWFHKIDDKDVLSELIRRLAKEQAGSNNRTVRGDPASKPGASKQKISRAVLKCMLQNPTTITRVELIDLLRCFGFNGIEDGDEDWLELQDDEDISFGEFMDWWDSYGSFRCHGGGAFFLFRSCWEFFYRLSAAGQTDASMVAAFFKELGADQEETKDGAALFKSLLKQTQKEAEETQQAPATEEAADRVCTPVVLFALHDRYSEQARGVKARVFDRMQRWTDMYELDKYGMAMKASAKAIFDLYADASTSLPFPPLPPPPSLYSVCCAAAGRPNSFPLLCLCVCVLSWCA